MYIYKVNLHIINVIQNPSGGFFSYFFLFGFQAFFEFLSGILNEKLNPSSGFNSFYSAPFELMGKNAA